MAEVYKVVIIDDMPDIVQNIVNSVDWPLINCVVSGTAEDGINAEELIYRARPDILITDIRMPGLDGLELSRRIQPLLPDIKIICITGFQDFRYAQEACNLGLFALITKPINLKDLTDVVRRAVASIEARDPGKPTERQEDSIEDNDRTSIRLPLVRKSIVVELINRFPVEQNRLESQLKTAGIHSCSFGIIVFRLLFDKTSHRDALIRSVENLHNLSESERVPVALLRDRSLILTIFFSASTPPAAAEEFLLTTRRRLTNNSGLNRDQMMTAVSAIYSNIRELYSAYLHAEEEINRAFFNPPGKGRSSAVSYSTDTKDQPEPRIPFGRLRRNIEEQGWDELPGIIDTFVSNLGGYSTGNPETARFLTAEICFTLRMKAAPLEQDPSLLSAPAVDYLEEIEKLGHISAYRTFLLRFYRDCRTHHDRFPSRSLIVRKALTYIEEHACAGISLSRLAEFLKVRPEYLSSLIKRETGCKYIELVTQARMQKAKELLTDPRNRISDIAESVGYNDYVYFFQVFKKVEGISPSEFRKL